MFLLFYGIVVFGYIGVLWLDDGNDGRFRVVL